MTGSKRHGISRSVIAVVFNTLFLNFDIFYYRSIGNENTIVRPGEKIMSRV